MTEGAASNIFVVKNGTLLAPPKDNLMLPGITYDVVLELAAANGIPHEVRRIAVAEVFAADELLLTSSTKEVLAITHARRQAGRHRQAGRDVRPVARAVSGFQTRRDAQPHERSACKKINRQSARISLRFSAEDIRPAAGGLCAGRAGSGQQTRSGLQPPPAWKCAPAKTPAMSA